MEIHDPTREKIMEAAGEIFADAGFQGATVRDICTRAGVNVAAVNYYFGDKTALYLEVLRASLCAANMDNVSMDAKRPPEDVLREIIHGMCRKMIASERPSWAFRLMVHELAQPTPALDRVIEEVIQPNYQRMCKVIGTILKRPPTHRKTRMCAHSIIAQVTHYIASRPVIAQVWPDLTMTPEQVEMLANHIAEFSLCSIQELARK